MNPSSTLAAWRLAAIATSRADNAVRVGDSLYIFDVAPRIQKNGAAVGRVYCQPRGGLLTDVGGYKIAPDGSVESIPEALAGILVAAQAHVASPPDDTIDEVEGGAA